MRWIATISLVLGAALLVGGAWVIWRSLDALKMPGNMAYPVIPMLIGLGLMGFGLAFLLTARLGWRRAWPHRPRR